MSFCPCKVEFPILFAFSQSYESFNLRSECSKVPGMCSMLPLSIKRQANQAFVSSVNLGTHFALDDVLPLQGS